MLKSGCDKYKTLSQLTNREEELYGSYLNAGTSKRGEHQVLGFSILGVNEKYLDEKILGGCIDLDVYKRQILYSIKIHQIRENIYVNKSGI